MSVPLIPARPAADADVEAVLDCLRSGWLTMGPRIAAFEAAFAERLGVAYAAAAAGERAALHLALAAVGLADGDEVVVPAIGGSDAAAAARRLGAVPVVADVAGVTLPQLDPGAVEERLTERTRAVIVVHAGGHPADTLRLRELCDERGLMLVEDVRGALGAADAGLAADAAAFGLSDGETVAVGEGGVVAARDEAVVARARLLRSHAMTSGTWDRHRGHAASYDIVDIGFNARLDEARAALGAARLARLDEELARRRATVRRYREELAAAAGVQLTFDAETAARSAPTVLPVAVAAAGPVVDALAAEGVETARFPALGESASVPRAAEAAERLLGLPVVGVCEEAAVAVATRLRAAAAR